MPVQVQVIGSFRQQIRLADSLNTVQFSKCLFIACVKSNSVLNAQLTTNNNESMQPVRESGS